MNTVQVIPTLNFHFAGNEKDDPVFGLSICQWIGSWYRAGYNDYFPSRTERFQNNRLWAEGRQPMSQFMDMMDIDGKSAYINIDFQPPAIMNKYVAQILDKFMDIDEAPSATAIDKRSIARKNREKKEAQYRMHHQQEIAQLQQQSGVQLEDPDAFTPKDKDDLELWFGLEYKLSEEAICEKLVKTVFDENGITETKRMVLKDLIVTGLGVVRIWLDVNGEIRIRRVVPENFFYSYSEYPDFRDAAFMGEIVNMKVTDFRKRFGHRYDEKKIFELASKYGQAVKKQNMSWNTQYYYMYYRPYDEWTLPLMYVEVKTDNTIFVKEKTSKNGLPIIDFSNTKPDTNAAKTTVTEKNLDSVYSGWWLMDSSEMLEWGKSKYQIRPPDNLSEQYFTYLPYLPGGFEMRNVAVPEKIKPAVFQMILAHLKIQQIIAKMKPPGTVFDIYGLSNITIGDGKTLTPLQMQQYYQQTGDYYYNSVNEDGERRQGPPITGSPNVEGIPQLNELVNIYNFYLAKLQDDLGTNPAAVAREVNARMGLGVMKQQIAAAGGAVSELYDGWLNIGAKMCKIASIMLWDDIVKETGAYRHFIDPGTGKINEDVHFEMKMKLKPSAEEKAYINQIAQSAVSAGILNFDQAFKIRNIENVKLAELYLARMQDRKVKQEMEKAMMQIKMNEQVQAASVAMNTKGRQQVQMQKDKGKLISQQLQGDLQKEQLLQQFIQNAMLQSLKTGNPLEGQIKEVVDTYLNAGIDEASKLLTEKVMGGQPGQPQGQQQPGQNQQMQQGQGPQPAPGQPGQPPQGQGQPQSQQSEFAM